MNGTLSEPIRETMHALLSRAWWVLALRGVVALLFGILAFVMPGMTLLWLVTLFAIYTLISGIASIIGAMQNRRSDREWWLLLLLGIVSVGVGIVALGHPGPTALWLVLLMAANALITGMIDIITAMRLRKSIQGEWLMVLAGLASIAFGIIVFLFPGTGALALVWLIGGYAVATGILLLALAFRARAWSHRTSPELTPRHA